MRGVRDQARPASPVSATFKAFSTSCVTRSRLVSTLRKTAASSGRFGTCRRRGVKANSTKVAGAIACRCVPDVLPYVLVGHSNGGRISRVYAKRYPRDVTGMVLIDPGRLDDDPRFSPQHHKERAAERRLITVARSVRRSATVSPRIEYYDLRAQQVMASDSFGITTRYWRPIHDHGRAMPQTLAQEREATSLGSLPPILVGAAAPDDETRRIWTKIDEELAALSVNGVHRAAPGATHQSLVWKMPMPR